MSDRERARGRVAGVQGSALVTVLWCVAILSTVTFSTLGTTRLDLRVARNHADRVQARYLALAAIERVKACLHREQEQARSSGAPVQDLLLDSPDDFEDIELGRGRCRVIRRPFPDEVGDFVFGVVDEERFLNVNTAKPGELAQLPDLDEETARALVDWRDRDEEPGDGGAEAETYEAMRPPHFIRNGPFETLRELLLVRDVDAERLLGEDANGDGLLNPNERDGELTPPDDDGDDRLDAGWSAYLTLESGVENTDAFGEPRIDIRAADAEQLATVDGISSELAEGIVRWREQRTLETLFDLLDAERMEERPGPASGDGADASAETHWEPTGEKLVDQDLLVQIGDTLTDQDPGPRPGVVNVNTCSLEVLRCLPGADDDVADAIVEYRRANGEFTCVAQLLEVEGLERDALKKLAPRICVRSGTYRVVAEGVIPASGARQRIAVTLRLGPDDVEVLSYREDL